MTSKARIGILAAGTPLYGRWLRRSRVGWLAVVVQEPSSPHTLRVSLHPLEQKQPDALKQEEDDERDRSHDR